MQELHNLQKDVQEILSYTNRLTVLTPTDARALMDLYKRFDANIIEFEKCTGPHYAEQKKKFRDFRDHVGGILRAIRSD